MMQILEKLSRKHKDRLANASATAVFLGDSVTHGCFELSVKSDGTFVDVFDWKESYSNKFNQLMRLMFPDAQLNVINSGISGDHALSGAARLERDVLSFHPDLVVVCFGLNDSTRGSEQIKLYTDSLADIFARVRASGADCIYMTPNAMCTVEDKRAQGNAKNAAEICSRIMNEGTLDRYIAEGKEVAKKAGVPVCDCYAIWKKMYEAGADSSDLLANYINHPVREMHWLFAHELFKTVLFG